MRPVAWTSDNGRTCTFEGGGPYERPGPYYFRELTSDLSATAETSKAPRQDGVTTYHTALDARTINLVGSMLVYGSRTLSARAAYDTQRAWLAQAFAPNRWGTLTYYKEDEAVQVRCRPLATPTIGTPVGTFSTIDISFTADSPYWESAKEYILAMGVIQRFWHFPWAPYRFPMGAYTRFGMVDNPAEENIYPSIEVYTTGQEVCLANRTTGEQVTIEHSIAENQKLVVDLKDVSAFLYQRDGSGDYQMQEDVSHWMSLDSVPWALRPGRNQVAITNDQPEDTPVAYLRYRIPSLGV